MKKVLVSTAIYRDNPITPIYGARVSYIKKLTKYGLLPIFVTPNMTQHMITELYDMCEGVYFIGGEDWDPAVYHSLKHPKTVVGEPERDIIELPLLQLTLQDKKPFLGICRGGQGLAIAAGGTLIQHLPDKIPSENHNPNNIYDDLLTSQKHPVVIDKKSKIYKIVKKGRVLVNSFHHQAIDNPGEKMKIVGTSPGGVVEIIESADSDYFCFGVNSHPEAIENSFLEELFKAFADHIQSRNVIYDNKQQNISTNYLPEI